ncbi:MAG: helix-turn-helix transcriptional regulator [Clostridia bacterium]|nr:helix-turn-helix transcriptional regulator [Clostridia bacterium]
MKSFFEKRRDDNQRVDVQWHGKRIFPPHFHSNLEIFIVKDGSYTVSCNNKSYKVTSGDVFIFESFDVHSYDLKLTEICDDVVFIIPYKYLGNFNEFLNGKSIKNPHLKNCDNLENLIEILKDIDKAKNEYKTQALVDLFLSTIIEDLTLTDQKENTDSYLIRQILEYIENNFKGECTRESIAQSLGYSNTYVSKVFNSFINTNISTYVNTLRLNYVEKNKNSDKTVLELIYESGFKSQQTYYRFLKNNK